MGLSGHRIPQTQFSNKKQFRAYPIFSHTQISFCRVCIPSKILPTYPWCSHTPWFPIHHGFPTTKRETMRTAPYCPGEVRLPAALAACGGIPEISHSQAVDCVAVVVGRWMRPIPQKKGCSQWSKWRTNEQFHELYIQVCFDRLLGQIVKSLLLNEMIDTSSFYRNLIHGIKLIIIEGSLEVKLPTIWTGEKQRWEESEKRRRKKIKKEKVSEERRSRCAKR